MSPRAASISEPSAADMLFRQNSAERRMPALGVALGTEIVDILIVDDQPEVVAVLKRQMHRKGYSVRTAGDAFEASAALAACHPRVILLDLMMPNIDGAAFLKRLREEHSPGALPVIIVTASDQRTDMLRCLDAGANDFIMKPVDLDALVARVEVQISISNRFRALERGGALQLDQDVGAREAIWAWRPSVDEFLVSTNFAAVCGAEPPPQTMQDWMSGLRPADARAFLEDLDMLREGRITAIERHVICGRGDRAVLIRATVAGDGPEERVAGAAVDVTEPFLRDKTSQLPADGALVDRLGLRRAQGRSAHLIMFDVRRFEELTLAHGIVRADDALQIYISAVNRAVQPVGELFRTGAHEFAILVKMGAGAARTLARQIASGDEFGVQVGDGQIHRVSSAVGMVTDSIEEPAETRFRAKLALKAAVETGAGHVREYSGDLLEERLRQARIESKLSTALSRGQIDVVFEPVADAATGRWVGIETTPRWTDPKLGRVPPAELAGAADLIGRSSELLEILARRAFRAGSAINAIAPEPLFVSLNVPTACAKSQATTALVERIAREEQFDLANAVFEVDEDDILGDYDACSRVFAALNKLGARVAIDNFGSSYSCLTYLCRVPSQILKLDEAVLDAADERPDARSMLGTTSRMAKHLGKSVVLNGVAEAARMQLAREVGADMVQGALASRPVSEDELVALIRGKR